MNRRAKIVATLGPSSNSKEIIEKLVQSGLNIARLNFSHGSHSSHKKIIKIIRALPTNKTNPIVILQDLQGPKLRVGKLPPDGIDLIAGEKISLVIDLDDHDINYDFTDTKIIYLDIPNILHCLKPKGKILFDDGKLELEIIGISDNEITARVMLGGTLYSNKGVNLPGTNLDIPGFTEKDQEDLAFGLKNEIDAVAISFVRGAGDILCVRDFIRKNSPDRPAIPIIAKLELPDAVRNLDEILDAADGVMVARGDLGVETSPSDVPIIQKEIIQAANQKSKIVITATQMLDSMIINPRPTRAEASDVANAIFDGTDAIMLSGESANGKYPVESVLMMDTIVRKAENSSAKWGHQYKSTISEQTDDASAISIAARDLAQNRQVSSVAVFTQSGRSALLQSKARPDVPILAFTPNINTFHMLGLYWGVTPYLVPFSNTLEKMIRHVEQVLMKFADNQHGQKVIIISGFPIGAMRSTNLALLHTIGSLEK
ncbi:MAG: pyruvate kinase [Pelolinea sp.]|nr:pyruvate kinase [Pelolinea sp.]